MIIHDKDCFLLDLDGTLLDLKFDHKFWFEHVVLCFSQEEKIEFEDAKRHFEESKYLNKRLTELYVKHNTAGKTYEELFETMKFDTFLRAEEAVSNGFADKVIEER